MAPQIDHAFLRGVEAPLEAPASCAEASCCRPAANFGNLSTLASQKRGSTTEM